MGDLSCPVAFELAKVLKRPPRKIAEELAPALVLPDVVVKRTVEGGGYLNFFVDRPKVLRAMLEDTHDAQSAGAADAGKLIVEHTNINPNKAAHIGHLRNAVLGDVLVRNFRRLGRNVEVQNYLDDTGVQVADVVVGLEHPDALVDPKKAAAYGEEIREILEAFPYDAPGVPGRRLGDLAWDLYALMGRSYAADPELEQERRATLHAIEGAATGHDQTPEEKATAAIAARLAEAVVRCHLLTMERIGVDYDLLPRESDILGRQVLGRRLRAPEGRRGRAPRVRGQERGLLGHAARGRGRVRGHGGRGQGPRALERDGHVHGQGRRLPALEAGRPRDRLRVRARPLRRRGRQPRVPRLGRRVAALPDAPRRRGRGPGRPRPIREGHRPSST